MANLKELSKGSQKVTGGHRLCPGCGAGIAIRQALIAAGDTPLVVTCATGCVEVSTTIAPFSAWKVPFLHSAFENSAANATGLVSAYRSLKKQGKIDKEIRFIAFGGDGGTYDIGLQALSGAMERGHKMLYICYNNEAYMNTGIQRSGATPRGADTTTAPVGKVIVGKQQNKKDLTQVIAAHNIPYVAQTYIGNWSDFTTKVQKALATDGSSFINIFTPCRLGWAYPPEDTMSLGRLAVETCIWPCYEIENGVYTINVTPKEKKPVIEFLKTQGRFKHLLKPENAEIVQLIQAEADLRWEILQRRAELGKAKKPA
jgi:pyruvate ferredoxin oxidoreductase beta subunit